MKFSDAIKLKNGEIIRNCFWDKMIVYKIEYMINFEVNKENCYIEAIDSRMNKVWLCSDDVYPDNEEQISDQEKCFIKWAKANKTYVTDNLDSLHIIRFCFLNGFNDGYEYKKEYTFKEMMEK